MALNMVFGENNKKLLKYSNHFHILLSVIITLGLYEIASAYLALLSGEELKNINSYSSILIIQFLFLLGLFGIYKLRANTRLLNILYLFILFSIIPIVLFSDLSVITFKAIIYSWLFILMFRYGYCLGYYDKQLALKINYLLLISLTVLIPLCIDGYILNIDSNFLISNDAIFSLAVFAPLPILFKNKKISYLLLFVIVVLALFSLKRSIIGAVALSMSLAAIILFINNKIYIILAAVLLILALMFGQNKLMNLSIIEAIRFRFEQGDSGRSYLQDNIIEEFNESSISEKLFGHGYGQTTKIIGIPAHNDFIEILYNYGIICLVLYSTTLLTFIYKCFSWYKYRKLYLEYYISFVMSISILLFLSVFNCMYTSMYINVLFLLIGISYGKIKFELMFNRHSKSKHNG